MLVSPGSLLAGAAGLLRDKNHHTPPPISAAPPTPSSTSPAMIFRADASASGFKLSGQSLTPPHASITSRSCPLPAASSAIPAIPSATPAPPTTITPSGGGVKPDELESLASSGFGFAIALEAGGSGT